ncbi:MAG TPA: hypothetical protein PLI34_05915, partial [Saprospiraceae bacterium]|nr:hypothetical protein [Saprospiraceae bacterium]
VALSRSLEDNTFTSYCSLMAGNLIGTAVEVGRISVAVGLGVFVGLAVLEGKGVWVFVACWVGIVVGSTVVSPPHAKFTPNSNRKSIDGYLNCLFIFSPEYMMVAKLP